MIIITLEIDNLQNKEPNLINAVDFFEMSGFFCLIACTWEKKLTRTDR